MASPSRSVLPKYLSESTLTCVAAMFVRDRAGHRSRHQLNKTARGTYRFFLCSGHSYSWQSCTGIMVRPDMLQAFFLGIPLNRKEFASAAASVTGSNLLGSALAGGWFFADRLKPPTGQLLIPGRCGPGGRFAHYTSFVGRPASGCRSSPSVRQSGVAYGWIASANARR